MQCFQVVYRPSGLCFNIVKFSAQAIWCRWLRILYVLLYHCNILSRLHHTACAENFTIDNKEKTLVV